MYDIKERQMDEEDQKAMTNERNKYKFVSKDLDPTDTETREGIYSFQQGYQTVKQIRERSETKLEVDMRDMAERFVLEKERKKENDT
jgi:hypothetical protein